MTDKEYFNLYEKLRRIGYQKNDFYSSHLMSQIPWIVKNIPFTSVLDVGCSSGGSLGALEGFRSGIKTYGVDISFFAAKNGYTLGRDIVCGSACNLPFKDKAFDLVISADCLEHLSLEDVDKMIAEIARVTKEYVFLKISTKQEVAAWSKIVKEDLHKTIMPLKWWLNKFFNAWTWPKLININDKKSSFCIKTN